MSKTDIFADVNDEDLLEEIKLLNKSAKTEYVNPKLLTGEKILRSTFEDDTFYFISQYRFGFVIERKFYIILIGMIYDVQILENHRIFIGCKDGKCIILKFKNNMMFYEWNKTLMDLLSTNNDYKFYFAFTFKSKTIERGSFSSFEDQNHNASFEYNRLWGENNHLWLLKDFNSKYSLCQSYPIMHIFPGSLNIQDLIDSSNFRSRGRFPSAVWRNRENFSILIRASQPCVGLLNSRSVGEESLIQTFIEIVKEETKKDHSLIIFDARTKSAALLNCAKGGGYENTAFYKNCNIKFAHLSNIHAINNLFYEVSKSYLEGEVEPDADVQYLDDSAFRYLSEISLLLKAGRRISRYLYSGNSVLVHCSDGWDRTSQLCSLSKLLIDPFYRTIKGFILLIQRDWLDYGHMFTNRCSYKKNQKMDSSPIFIVFLDCVYQIIRQFSCQFEFTESLLHKIIDHVYSNLYGTFFGNSCKERNEITFTSKPNSLWNFIEKHLDFFYNLSYVGNLGKTIDLLIPQSDSRNLVLWHNLFSIKRSAFDVDISYNLFNQVSVIKNENSLSTKTLIEEAINDVGFISNNQIEVLSVEPDKNLNEKNPQGLTENDFEIVNSPVYDENCCENFILPDHFAKYKNDGILPFHIKINSLLLGDDGLPIQVGNIYKKLKTIIRCIKGSKIAQGSISKSKYSDPNIKKNDHLLKFSNSQSTFKNYEKISINDYEHTRWVPDHLVSSCRLCGTEFWFLTRKHHCRRCGEVFCRRCCSNRTIVEKELIFSPVRVCNNCYRIVSNFQKFDRLL